MVVGVYRFELHLAAAGSLKQKRQIVRRIKERLRSRHNVAVSESEEFADLWQRAALSVVSLANRREPLDQLFEAVRREAEVNLPGHFIDAGCDFLELDETGFADDWDSDDGWEDAPS